MAAAGHEWTECVSVFNFLDWIWCMKTQAFMHMHLAFRRVKHWRRRRHHPRWCNDTDVDTTNGGGGQYHGWPGTKNSFYYTILHRLHMVCVWWHFLIIVVCFIAWDSIAIKIRCNQVNYNHFVEKMGSREGSRGT